MVIGGKQILPPRGLPTPFGKINLPRMETPVLRLPEVDDRRKEAIKHAVGSDLTGALGIVPLVGSFLAGQIADLHFAEMRRLLTGQEMNRFIEADKRIPSNAGALAYSFVRGALNGYHSGS